MTSVLCVLALWQPATAPLSVPKDVRGVAITLTSAGADWFEVTLKKCGEDWDDVLPEPAEDAESANRFYAGIPWSGNSQPRRASS